MQPRSREEARSFAKNKSGLFFAAILRAASRLCGFYLFCSATRVMWQQKPPSYLVNYSIDECDHPLHWRRAGAWSDSRYEFGLAERAAGDSWVRCVAASDRAG